MVKLSRTDKEILEMLRKTNPGLSQLRIAKYLEKDPAHIHRRLNRMVIHGVLDKIKSKPNIFKIKLTQNTALTVLVVMCPKCGQEHNIHHEQSTVLCNNKGCLTQSGYRTRFYVTNKRIKNAYKI